MSSILSKLINLAGNITGVLAPSHGGTGVAGTQAATAAKTANAIIQRDGSGNFAAGTAEILSLQLDDSGSNSVQIAAPSTISASYSLVMPSVGPNTGEVMVDTGGGVLGWETPATASAITDVKVNIISKPAADLASTTNIASLSGEQTIDGTMTFATPVLLKNQTDNTENGLWITSSGPWARSGYMPDNTASALSAIIGIDGINGGTNTKTLWYSQADFTGAVPFVQIPTTGSNTPLAASKALTTNASGQVAASATTATELGYVSGVTSALQTQLNAKQTTALSSADILVGNVSNVATAVAVTGDIALSNAGLTRTLTAPANVIINGNFDFWQRGTSFASPATHSYTGDRFAYYFSGSHRETLSQSTDVPTQAQSGFNSNFSLLSTVTTAEASFGANDFAMIRYAMEGFDYQPLNQNKIRLQFWVKATGTSVTGTYSVSFFKGDSTRAYTTSYTLASSGVWQHVAIDLTTDTVGTWASDNSAALLIDFVYAAGSNFVTSSLNAWANNSNGVQAATGQVNVTGTNGNTFQIAQVMLTLGDFSTVSGSTVPFRRAGRTIGDELRMCQRYFTKSFPQGTTPAQNAGGTGAVCGMVIAAGAGVQNDWFYSFPVTMRAGGNYTFYNPSAANGQARNFSTGTDSTSIGVGFLTAGDNGFCIAISQPASWNAAGQSYGFHYAVDAEL